MAFVGGVKLGVDGGRRRVVTCVGPGGGKAGGKPAVDPGSGSGATVLERPTQTQKARIDPGKRYKVIIFNETGQTREFIMNVLQKCLPGMGEGTAKDIADRTKKVGQAVVGAWIFEMAEAYCDSLRSSGLSADIQLE
mmetsp:Transcript_9397/g.28332  ORF Transcript_9397/g.28332 Transcript_9397/m.28332 type:complete len:137 (+) Transcript_9397:143-553(+)|eukprot:CAMPEP_0198730270 /NCGR_PEP_ID=MMETSP1475-20131203/23710_1 /TAXON_ID= ORGANISM="Unidentified sp., Strain CCMP1999" /NCGR_SAMPLE_ID=MMETSP1475 /ASSEMBLY_ACC=CAM_ASM_001111 /LENGTH=136 /DNA_ID=CAMNT_0044493057 /DNA_START=128 /DNA_END=538 /DNA_ORIENTATION=-